MADRSSELTRLLRAYKREWEKRQARAEECRELAAQMTLEGESRVAVQLQLLGRDHQVKALELKGRMAALRYENKLPPFID